MFENIKKVFVILDDDVDVANDYIITVGDV